MKRLLYLTVALALLGCEAPSFGFLPCSAPKEVTEATDEPNALGCWRLTAAEDHGFLLDDPGELTCQDGTACVVVVPGQRFWYAGAGYGKVAAEDVDCSEVCP